MTPVVTAAVAADPLEPLLREAARRLAGVSDSPRAEAERLLAEVQGLPRSRLVAGLAPPPDAAQRARFEAWIERRSAGEPHAYLIGRQPFRQIEVAVTPAVLIPRPETELLVDWALECLQALADEGVGDPAVWDVATGSGCVALALACERPGLRLAASDLSAAALAVARANGEALGCTGIEWLQADALALPEPGRRFDLIVANPPYIAEQDPHLPALRHEPTLALVSGAEGLDCLRRLVAQAPGRLHAGGRLLLEHGYDQAAAVRALLAQAGFAGILTRRDYGGQERLTGGRWP